ncbi:MAG: hypothetical protein IPK17_17480 [Chloroflexi bacterium]|uniref:hypothetical protein n=1 Tax=Candidatus Flexifilum breve TaxID=3140694 RepID=UPI003135D30E|nr:hypothetical protein [Chloroflexota bacterium]
MRWIVGMKRCWLLIDWDKSSVGGHSANVHDRVSLPLVTTQVDGSIVFADTGFNDANGIPANLKLFAGHLERAGAGGNALSLVTLYIANLRRTLISHLVVLTSGPQQHQFAAHALDS